MAKKKNSSNSDKRTVKSYMPMFSFVAVMLLGFALLLSFTLGQISDNLRTVAAVIMQIGIAIALIVPVVYSFYYARKRKQVWFVLWIIAVILVVVFFILANLNI